MFKIDQITSDVRQKKTVVMPDGTTFVISLYFIEQQRGWFIDELKYGENFVLKGLRISLSPNILHQFKNLIPFGLCCLGLNEREPMFLEDFSSGSCTLYAMSKAETESYEEYLRGN